MPSYKILKEEVATMDGVEGVVYEVELKTDGSYPGGQTYEVAGVIYNAGPVFYSEVQKYFATSETKESVLEEATKSFQNNQPKVNEVKEVVPPVEVEVTL